MKQEEEEKVSSPARSAPTRSVVSNSAIFSDDEPDTDEDDEYDITTSPASQQTFVGLDASMLLLRQVWTSGPFWGLLGVGQGATVASLFSLLPTTYPPPQCLVLCRAREALLRDEERLSHVPCLHLLDSSSAAASSSDLLVSQFGGQVARSIEPAKRQEQQRQKLGGVGAQNVFSKSDLNLVGRFLVSQQRTLRGGGGRSALGREIVALQSALHAAELEAGEFVAREIAANPPKSLMAIILPQHVGGWHGGRRRQPGEQGGGAPCPEEFLLNREKRTADTEGASRHHPQAEKAMERQSEETTRSKDEMDSR
jgi:hypothetical protein